MVHQFKTSIVRVFSPYGEIAGTGFLISETYILTCAHVITQELSIPQDTLKIPEVCLFLILERRVYMSCSM